MKRLRLFVKFFLLLLILLLAGCRSQDLAKSKADKTELSQLLQQAANLPEETYTTASREALQKAVATGTYLQGVEWPTQEQVDAAAKELYACLRRMAVATKGVYQITSRFSLRSNDAVGDEWEMSCCYNGETIYSGQRIEVPLGAPIQVGSTVWERDKIPDKGAGQLFLTAENGYTGTATVVVEEQGGRFAGRRAVWEWVCTASLVEWT